MGRTLPAGCYVADVRFGPGRFVTCSCGARVEGAQSDGELGFDFARHKGWVSATQSYADYARQQERRRNAPSGGPPRGSH